MRRPGDTGTRGNSEQVIRFREGMGVMEVEGVVRSPLQLLPSILATSPKLKSAHGPRKFALSANPPKSGP
jgi:hypothetical protein